MCISFRFVVVMEQGWTGGEKRKREWRQVLESAAHLGGAIILPRGISEYSDVAVVQRLRVYSPSTLSMPRLDLCVDELGEETCVWKDKERERERWCARKLLVDY